MSLGQRVASAVKWSAGLKIGFQTITWAMTLLVIRILSPDDYGLMALSQLFVTVLIGVSDFCLGDALIQQRETPKPMVAGVFGLLLVLTTGATILLALAAYPIADWYREPRLVGIIQVSSLTLLFTGVSAVPRAMLLKSLRVRPMFLVEMSSGLSSAVCVIALAYSGWGVWALVLGTTLGHAVRLLGYVVLTGEYWVWPSLDFRPVRPLLGFGAFRTLETVAWLAFTSADTLIIGRVLGPGSLGLYSVALNFAAMPLAKIAPVITQVAFPAFALVQANPAEARFYALKAMRLMAAIMVPIFFGISALAPEIVGIVFGPNWAEATPMLATIAIAMSVRAVLLVLPLFLQGIGDARAGFWCTASAAAVFAPAFLVGVQFGVIGVCVAWVAGYPVVFVINAVIAARQGRLPLGALLWTPVRPVIAATVMLAAVAGLRPLLDTSEAVRAGILVAAGALVYGAVMLAVFRSQAMEVLRLVRMGRTEG